MRLSLPLMTALPCVLALAAPADMDWHLQPAFSIAPAFLLREAQIPKPKEGEGILELLEETKVTFDAQGRRETRNRYIFRVDHESAIESWRSVGVVWAPWHQERPSIRARVITPDGKVHSLDLATIGEFPINEEGTKLYDDRKRLAAPLPQLSVGSVAEVEIITRETVAVHKAGSLVSIALHQPVPVMHTRVVLDMPESIPFQWKLRGLGPVQPQKTTENARVRLTVELGATEPPEEREYCMDPEVQPLPSLSFSTVPSWGVAAASYAEIVERQIAEADLSAWVKQAVGETVEPKEKVDRLLARLNQTIRYTGVEFGEAGIVPRTPAEVIQRGFGDCKDKAALLVAMLRVVGIQAQLALLETGPGKDVNPDLPGLNDFDHAIVFVPGASPMWIDPTVEYARAGELPFSDQGRWALIVGRETKSLIRTPIVPSIENMTLETREIFLAESGKARIVETSHPSGLGEMRLRSGFSPTEPKKLRENLKKYVQNYHSATELGEFTIGDPADLSRPFIVRLEALGCGSAITTDVDAAVTLNAWSMSKGLRDLIPTSFDRQEKEPAKVRKQDLFFPEPFAVEWRHKIIPPIGFEPRPLPESDEISFGPASLTRTYKRSPEGYVLATFKFDSGKVRWTAAEVETARAALEKFGNSTPTRLLFDQVGEAHLAAGRIKDAIQTFRAQANAQPAQGVPLSRLAIALIRGGLGEAARDVARKACQLEPKNMFTHRALGWVLLHDLVNQAYHKGWDYQGALSAYRKAKELDPKDGLTRKNLAILLEHNSEGVRYGVGAQLDQAIQEYLDLRKELQVEDMNINLLVAFGRAGRYKELEECAKSLPASNEIHAWLVTATAVNKGIQAAIKEAIVRVPDQGQRRNVMLTAGDLLVSARYYTEAAALLSAGADGAANAPAIRGRAAILAKTKRFEDVPIDRNSPASAVWRLMQACVDASTTEKDLSNLFTPALLANAGADNNLKGLRKVLGLNTLKRDGTGIPPAVGLDVVLALSQVVVEGNEANGFRVRIQMPGTAESKNDSWYVIREKGQFFLAAMDGAPSTYGIEALRRLEKSDLSGAKAMLDRAREIVWAGNADEPLSGHPFCRFWKKGQEATSEEIRMAAASLQAPDKDCRQAVSILEAGRASAKDSASLERIDAALQSAYMMRKDWASLLPISERMIKAYPTSKSAAMGRVVALGSSKKWAELLQYSEQLLTRDPNDLEYMGCKSNALGMLGRYQEREDLLKTLIASGKASALEFNNLAWSHLVQDRVTDQSLEWARRSVLLESKNNGAAQHTLASILAERGESTEALEIFFKELSSLEDDELRGQDWYLIGRIAEQFGETEAAIGCYRRVPLPKDNELEEDSCHTIATRRLKALGKL